MYKDKMEHDCFFCSKYQYDAKDKRLKCTLNKESKKCYDLNANEYRHWTSETQIDLEKYACIHVQTIYDSLKAKLFNILESQLPPEPDDRRLKAVKNITEDIISKFSNDVKDIILESKDFKSSITVK